MRIIFFLILLIFVNNCSSNEKKVFKNNQKLNNDNLMKMTFDEYNSFIFEYVKKSKYPSLEND